MYLVIVDTAQIQPYIFGSNRLRENVGASHLVAQATTAWAKEAVRQVAARHNIQSEGTLDDTKSIENPSDPLDAEVLYAGGGNFVVLFRDESSAKAFTRVLSRKVLTDVPDLQLVIVHNPFDWGESLAQKIKATFMKLAEEKRARIPSAPLLGLGVTVMCRSTGLPAVAVARAIRDDPERPVSAEILAKLRAVERKDGSPSEADQRLRELLPPPDGYDYPSQLDHLGGTRGEHNFIAVVHADGNGLGQRIMAIGEKYRDPSQNREYIKVLRSFSEEVDRAAQQALKDVLDQLARRIQTDGGNRIVHQNALGKIIAEVQLRREDGKWLLPFRPIVFGGDDVTFVCDGRLGLSLAIEYMRRLEEHTRNLPDGKGRLTACAGVAIVKAHYPFARAYALADELCRKAKNYRRIIRDFHGDWDGSCLDWHFALSGLSGGIEEIREREYSVSDGSLTLRPVTLGHNPKERHRTWTVIEKGITEFQGENWAGRRNKVKALRDALREGPRAVQYFRMKFNENQPLPEVEPSLTDWKSTGWQGGCCGYFDALELADWFIPL
ncbi:hypothetical protein HRbin08_00905 [bacterium HR08]|nr:hypothetical protein HRbin08_00905 [bacterium HR08]